MEGQHAKDVDLSRKAQRVARALLGGVGLIVGLLLCEMGLRVFAAVDPAFASRLRDPLAVLVEPYGEWGYRQKPGAVFVYPEHETAAVTNLAGYRGPLVASPKPGGTLRVVLLGGSATHGWGVSDSQTIDSYMRQILASRNPAGQYEVVNLAFDAYDSWQMYERLRTDGIPLDPDVVIVNAGINDVRNARFPDLQDRDPRTMIWEGAIRDLREGMRHGRIPMWLRVKHHLFVARVPALLHALVATRRGTEGQASAEKPHGEALDYFERNIRLMADLALDHGAALLLSTPPSSLALNFAPEDTSVRDYWIVNAAVTQQVRDSLAARMQALQQEYASRGLPVAYVRAPIPGEDFLDDAHLTAEGNRLLASVYVDQLSVLVGAR